MKSCCSRKEAGGKWETMNLLGVDLNRLRLIYLRVCIYVPINCMLHPPPRGIRSSFVAPWVRHGGALFLKTGCSYVIYTF